MYKRYETEVGYKKVKPLLLELNEHDGQAVRISSHRGLEVYSIKDPPIAVSVFSFNQDSVYTAIGREEDIEAFERLFAKDSATTE